MEFQKNEHEISMSQSKYICDILNRFIMINCKPVLTPMNSSDQLLKEMCPENQSEIKEVKNFKTSLGP